MKILQLTYLAVTFAFSLIAMWAGLQRIAPMISETAAALAQIPNLFGILAVGVAVTYILGLFR